MKKHTFLYFNKAWNSSTFTAFAGLLSQALSLVVVLPIILNRFREEDIVLYFIFSTIIAFQIYLSFGFEPTFTRLVSYAKAGLKPEEMKCVGLDRAQSHKVLADRPAVNSDSLELVLGTMRAVHLRLLQTSIPVFTLIGTAILIKPINAAGAPEQAWLIWVLVVSVTSFKLWGNQFESHLKGIGQIALIERWKAIFNIIGISSMALCAYLFDSIYLLIATHQFWQSVTVFRNFLFSKKIAGANFSSARKALLSPEIHNTAWLSAWRSGVGAVLTNGTTQLLLISYAAFMPVTDAAKLLLSVKMVTLIDQFSMVPFYSQIPRLNTLLASDRKHDLRCLCRNRVAATLVLFTCASIFVALSGDFLLDIIGSNTGYIGDQLWLLLALAFFAQRYAFMHQQIYSTTNNIIDHWLSGFRSALLIPLAIILPMAYSTLGIIVALLICFTLHAICARTYSQRVLAA